MPGKADRSRPSPVYRQAEPDDIERMWEIDQICFKPGIAFTPDIFYYYLLIQHDPAFVAEADGEIVAFVLCARDEDGTGMIVTIDVLEKYRRKGIGHALMEMAEGIMFKRKNPKIVLQVSVDNKNAISFYGKLGYRETGAIRDYYGEGGHALTFEKEL